MATDVPLIEKVSVSSLPKQLLLEADPDETSIETYPKDGIALRAALDGVIAGICVLAFRTPGELELLNIAVMPALQQRGIGSLLLNAAIDTAHDHSCQRLTLGTGAFGHQLSFYQRHGLRVVSVQKDYFTEYYDRPLFENGIQHQDRLWLVLDLSMRAGK
ncbi:Acetyltransferase (GNAT) family protein [Kushneria avicenniae]|uniref:Acetyltransferase (GNAT) family protein n=1 Tax=Kushneria avicenniae TaxID=402385 RepID=A0A1I1KVG5_9GAMM|nr:GNAT family N-acetyltransferase [Kushneria avicenniae]SFC64595.1 Acetyltransferase (GNAT) family protein [Kushneria avicenniae]